MDFILPEFKPTQTISINPPGGTQHPHHGHHSHLPLPTDTFPHPHPHFIHATHTGEVALWVIWALFALGFLGVFFLALRVEKKARIFHWLSAIVLGTAMLSYFAMANRMGVSFVSTKYEGSQPELVHLFREIYWARYVDWLITTPILLVSLAFLSGLSPADTLLTILADVAMVLTGLFSALTPARYNNGERTKWGWYAISCVAFLAIWFVLFTGGAKAAANRQRKTKGLFWLLSLMTFLLWTAYPIVFGLSEGANKISLDAEIIAYGVLDVAAKIGFTFLLLIIHTHGEDDTYILPDWFILPRQGRGAADGRGAYGSLRAE